MKRISVRSVSGWTISLKGKNLVFQLGESREPTLTPSYADAFFTANGEINFCSFHDTIPSGQLTELSNHVRASATGTGKVFISDIMVLYQMEV